MRNNAIHNVKVNQRGYFQRVKTLKNEVEKMRIFKLHSISRDSGGRIFSIFDKIKFLICSPWCILEFPQISLVTQQRHIKNGNFGHFLRKKINFKRSVIFTSIDGEDIYVFRSILQANTNLQMYTFMWLRVLVFVIESRKVLDHVFSCIFQSFLWSGN